MITIFVLLILLQRNKTLEANLQLVVAIGAIWVLPVAEEAGYDISGWSDLLELDI